MGQNTASINLGWTASPDPRVVAYNLYSGAASQTYTNILAVGNITNAVVNGLVSGTTYFFSVAAVDAIGNESPFCNEVSFTATNGASGSGSNAPNTVPTITAVADQIINANSTTPALPFAVGDLETPADSLSVSAVCSNPTLVPDANIIISGTGTNRTITLTPAPGQTGTATIALTVCDPSLCGTISFQLIVNPLPSIVLTSPSDGAAYIAPATVNLAASVTANGHPISNVQFFNGSTLLGQVTSAPYTFTWTGAGQGSYALSAKAIYDLRSTVSSAAVTINVGAASPLPAPWQTLDVGSVGASGTAVVSNSVYRLTGAGNVSGSSDNFRFLYQTLSGDGEVRAQVSSLQNTSGSALSGVMIREALTSSSRYAMMAVTPNGSMKWQRRSNTTGNASTTKGGNATLPNVWLRVTRTGNTLSGYKSTDGNNWTLVNSATVTMAPNIYIGLVAVSGTTTSLTTALSANVTVVP